MIEASGVLKAWKVRWKQCDCALFWSGDSAKLKSSLLIGRLIRWGPRFQNQGAKKGGAQGRKLVYDPYENHMESIRITANKMESIRITIHKLDFFDNITKVGRIVIYEFTTPFTGRGKSISTTFSLVFNPNTSNFSKMRYYVRL